MSLQVPNLYPAWKFGVDYVAGERVLYNGVLYKILLDHVSQSDWAPNVAVSLFAKILIPDENIIPEWEQPDSTNPYMKGDKVKQNGLIYESLIDYNVHSPADYPFGWQLIEE
jgi:hypothetical protein